MSEAEEEKKSTNFEDVTEFHKKFDIDGFRHGQLTKLDGATALYRVGFLQEELTEFVNGWSNDDLEKMIDSLIDLVYVAMGTANLMGVSPRRWQDCWDEVQRANMSKVRKPADQASARGHSLDVVKPEGWVGPTTFVCPEWELPSFGPGGNAFLKEVLEIAIMKDRLEQIELDSDAIREGLRYSAVENLLRNTGMTSAELRDIVGKIG